GDFTGYLVSLSGTDNLIWNIREDSTSQITLTTTETWEDGAWHCVAVRHDGTSSAAGAAIFADGKKLSPTVTADTLTGSIANSVPFQISGSNGNNFTFPGYIDDVAVYAVAL